MSWKRALGKQVGVVTAKQVVPYARPNSFTGYGSRTSAFSGYSVDMDFAQTDREMLRNNLRQWF